MLKYDANSFDDIFVFFFDQDITISSHIFYQNTIAFKFTYYIRFNVTIEKIFSPYIFLKDVYTKYTHVVIRQRRTLEKYVRRTEHDGLQ